MYVAQYLRATESSFCAEMLRNLVMLESVH